MKMTVNVRGELVQREVDRVEPSSVGPPRQIPVTRKGEEIVWLVSSDIPIIIDLGPGYSASRDSKYGSASDKPWDRLA